jgi:hypothetical protein
MGLLNIGRKEGSEIIQLFGRGVRLQGKLRRFRLSPDKSRYRTTAFAQIHISGNRVNQALSERRVHKGNKDY